MSPGSNTESYPAFAPIRLRENPGKNLNQSGHKGKNTGGGEFDPVLWIGLRRSSMVKALGQFARTEERGDGFDLRMLDRTPLARARRRPMRSVWSPSRETAACWGLY
ncbi:hypothetical protein ANN_23096 [Periplaneta americana]|uniref:Uncharacterized protein n=1 Tax=Periplaneta americana TaxID=6978 RepID=A0ABQ8SK46_PERAM|nr:hypothetical protein ANN_23096 [Periplaneta americana]